MATNTVTTTRRTTVNTTGATETTGLTFAPQPSTLVDLEVTILAAGTGDFAEGGSYRRYAAFLVDADGAVTQIGSTQTIGTDLETTGGWTVDIDVDNDIIRVRVTGAADTAVTWMTDATIRQCGTYVANFGMVP